MLRYSPERVCSDTQDVPVPNETAECTPGYKTAVSDIST